MRITSFMPEPRLHELDSVAVAADPQTAWSAVRAADLQEALPIRALFELRIAPDRLAALVKRAPQPVVRGKLDDVVGPGSGFHLLAEEAGQEIVVGAIGKFWKPKIPFLEVTPEGFAPFAEPGFGKVAWCLRVDPRAAGGSWVTVDVRVTATDDASWRIFRRYWKIIGKFSHGIRRILLAGLVKKLGAPKDGPLAGDELLPKARLVRTHHATLAAPPAKVWPWLVQMGCRRGGWYSYDRLDNGGVPSADRIIPELQKLAVGDILPARPKGDEGFAVLALEPARALVLGSPSLRPNGGPDLAPYRSTWAFDLEPIGDFATALSVRVRADYTPSPRLRLTTLAIGAAHEIMEREQLRNLTRLAVRPAPGAPLGPR